MIREWHVISFDRKEEDKTFSINSWGRQQVSWEKFEARRDEAMEWCKGPMIHGRFSMNPSWGSTFYFKNRKDAMAFKLTFGGT